MQYKTIGILYICTGQYRRLWKQFYESFELHFLHDTKKHYFVFTDAPSDYILEGCDSDRVSVISINNLPWPLITLLRFRFFLSIQDELSKYDYLMFSNANLACNVDILEKEFLPNAGEGKRLAFVQHPGYWQCPYYKAPFERDNRSLAFVPYSYNIPYVIGALFCGESSAFLEMSTVLNGRIESDLKNNVIARWHDESHLNRYLINRDDIAVLSPSYCYPAYIDIDAEKKIYSVDKAKIIDIKAVKGDVCRAQPNSFFYRIRKWFMLNHPIKGLFDVIFHFRVEKL